MKNIYLTIVALMTCVLVYSQKEVELGAAKGLEYQGYYIKDILDDRQQQKMAVVENSSGGETDLILKDGASSAIKSFTDKAIPKIKGSTPITIRIKSLEIQQAQTGIDEITTRAYLKLSFCKKQGDKYETLYTVDRYEEGFFSLDDKANIYDTHEKRIRAALEYCISNFGKFLNSHTKNTAGNGKETFPDNISSPHSSVEPLGKWYDLITYKRIFNKHNDGWEIRYMGFADNDTKFIVPFQLTYGQMKSKSGYLEGKGYSSLDTYSVGAGFNGLLKIVPGVYLNLGANLPLGLEVLRDLKDDRSYNLLVGIGASQGVRFIPWKNFGLVFGFGISESIQTSKVHKSNFGWELEIGINL